MLQGQIWMDLVRMESKVPKMMVGLQLNAMVLLIIGEVRMTSAKTKIFWIQMEIMLCQTKKELWMKCFNNNLEEWREVALLIIFRCRTLVWDQETTMKELKLNRSFMVSRNVCWMVKLCTISKKKLLKFRFSLTKVRTSKCLKSPSTGSHKFFKNQREKSI